MKSMWTHPWGLAAVSLVLLLCGPAPAVAVAPEVTNVVAQQRDGAFVVDITYDLVDVDSGSVWVSVLLSADGGITFDRPCLHVSGDTGPGVTPGTGRHIVWQANKDAPGLDVGNAIVRVWADDAPPNPTIAAWWRTALDGTSAVAFAAGDTLGFGRPLRLEWTGVAPAVAGLPPEFVAQRDTIFPFDDGLSGYKWMLLGELGGNCLPVLEDCWHPRRFNEATGDSFSYFGDANSLTFHNDGSSLTNPFDKLLPSGPVSLRVNALDILGNEILPEDQDFSFIVNYDPETVVLNGQTDWAHPSDPELYPYYVLLGDPARIHYPFADGDRIPDRTYVVVKALTRDDPRDARLDPDRAVNLTGWLEGSIDILTGGQFRFATDGSDPGREPSWGPSVDGWYGDTLGFLVGPNTTYTVNLQAIDEHDRRDGTPARLGFDTGLPPCVQCVELLPKTTSVSAWTGDLECVGPDPASHPCFADTAVIRISQNGIAPDELQYLQNAFIAVSRSSGYAQTVTDTVGLGRSNYLVEARIYRLTVLLHGLDDAQERWIQPLRRIGAWRYQVDYDCDPYNLIRDGGGVDDIGDITWGDDGGGGLAIDPPWGLWRLNVDIAVPSQLLNLGPDVYRQLLFFTAAAGDQEVVDLIFAQTTRQTGSGSVRVVALDQTSCGFAPLRPATYNLFRNVRPTVATPPAGSSWRDCGLAGIVPGIKAQIPLAYGAMESRDGVAVTKHFRIVVTTPSGDFACGD